jgi:hypothetical protein
VNHYDDDPRREQQRPILLVASLHGLAPARLR